MGKKKKLIRFKENEAFKRLLQPSALDLIDQDHEFKGNWNEKFFCNHNNLVLELGCGHGEYTIGLAKLDSETNYIGIDIKGSRLFFGAEEAESLNLANAGFIRTQIELIPKIFAKEIAEIWITFPDPFLERVRRRLTCPNFLNRYHQILKPGARVNLKTDDYGFFEFTKQIAEDNQLVIHSCTDDLYHSELMNKVLMIQTTYEKKFLEAGKKICYLQFSIDKEIKPLKKEK